MWMQDGEGRREAEGGREGEGGGEGEGWRLRWIKESE